MIETIGRYRIESALGEGAMADVYRAFDPGINRPLAIKVLKREFLRDRQYADRFLREAKAAGALSHPNIVTVFDVGEADGHPYIGMELLEGRSLDQLLAQGPVDPVTTLGIGIQIADALAFAHAQGVVHRDIKPSNIIVSPDGRVVKLLDFGIARVADAVFEAESVRTQVGQVLGTPRYMSPEQALGDRIDGRSDLFSLGVLLYEMLSGRRAFPGASSATLAIQIVQREPEPLAKIAPDTPGGLQFIVNKLLSKESERRFANGAQLADAMRKELAALSAVGDEERARATHLPIQVRLPILLALITALVLGAAIWTVLSRQYRAMEQVALASGNAISAFVASNAGLRAVENATLPAGQQDWAPVEAFVRAATADANVRRIVVVGADGIVRASSDARLTGQPYRAETRGEIVERGQGMTVTAIDGGERAGAFRFVRPITYAGRSFGQVDVEVSKGPLEAAARLARLLLAALGAVTLGGVAATSYLGARALAAPIRRMRAALLEAARGNLDFRISHNRKDEFGELFDSFNLAAGALQERLFSVEQLALSAPSAASERVPAPATAPLPTDRPSGRVVDAVDAPVSAPPEGARVNVAEDRLASSAPDLDPARPPTPAAQPEAFAPEPPAPVERAAPDAERAGIAAEGQPFDTRAADLAVEALLSRSEWNTPQDRTTIAPPSPMPGGDAPSPSALEIGAASHEPRHDSEPTSPPLSAEPALPREPVSAAQAPSLAEAGAETDAFAMRPAYTTPPMGEAPHGMEWPAAPPVADVSAPPAFYTPSGAAPAERFAPPVGPEAQGTPPEATPEFAASRSVERPAEPARPAPFFEPTRPDPHARPAFVPDDLDDADTLIGPARDR